ncbi:MAG: GNAT family N-acetyltransferase [Myxococcota bacterium]
MQDGIVFIDYKKDHELELLSLWRKSFHQAVGIEEDVRQEVIQEHLGFLRSLNPESIRVALEKTTNQIAGFMRKEESVIEQLFVHHEHQRKGLGSRFIQQAKEESDFLSLSTFELNKGAQQFYEFHDFVITGRGFASANDNSWATTREQLADITYGWRRSVRR